LLNWPLW